MRAGVLDGYRTCVSWFHYWDFIERFPAADPDLLIADRLFVIDRRRITCSGGRASIDVAAAILLRHFDHATVQKALRILLVGEMQKGNAPQPHPPGLEPATHPKVKRAILLMEQHVGRALSLDGREQARFVDAAARAAVQGGNGQAAGVREAGAAAHGRVAADELRPHGGRYRVELRIRRCVAPRARIPQAVRRAACDVSGAWREVAEAGAAIAADAVEDIAD